MLNTLGDIILRANPLHLKEGVRSATEARYAYRDGEHELQLILRGVGEREVQAIMQGDAEFALVVDDPLIVLCARFGEALPWSAAPVGWPRHSNRGRRLPPAPHSPEEARALLHVALIEADGGAIRAERNVTLWLDFTRALHAAIHDRARLPFDPRAHDRAFARLRRRCPTTEALVASACARTIGSP